jgi:iron complex transport system substrate-binding protein
LPATSRHAARRVLRPALALLVALLAVAGCAAPKPGSPSAGPPTTGRGPTTTVTDVLGRHVDVPVPATRILLDGARLLYTTALLNPRDPGAGIVGWPDDLKQNDPDSWRAYLAAFPGLANIPITGQLYDGSFSIERAVSLRPDVFVVSAANFPAAQDAGTIDRLAALGVPTVVVDYFVDPLRNTVPSVELMGQLTGHPDAARRYIDYYRAQIDLVRGRLDTAHPAATPTFLWRAPGYFDCCSSFAHSNLGSLVTFAGGENLADRFLPTKQGTLSPETVLSQNPAVIIATGADWAPGTPARQGGFVALGYDETPTAAQAQLRAIVERQAGFDRLGAVTDRRTYAVWHHFYDSPYNGLAIAWFAKWLHPQLFTDIDPTAMTRELHQRFLPVPATGTFWTGLG